jgi:hypothetical protein
MSIIFVDSFDGYTNNERTNYWADNGAAATIDTNTFRNGGQSMKPSAQGIKRSLNGQQSGIVVGFAWRADEATTHLISFTLETTTGTQTITHTQCSLFNSPDGRMQIDGTASSVYSSATGAFFHDRWTYIEWAVVFNHSGTNQIYIDGQKQFDAVVDCQNGTAGNANFIYLFGQANTHYDDFYIVSQDGLGWNTNTGDVAVVNKMPSGDGTFTEWTPIGVSTTTHFANVNEIPSDGDTGYNVTGTVSARDVYTISTVTPTDIVPGVQLVEITRDDGGTATQSVTPLVVVSGTSFTNAADDYNPPATFTIKFKEYDTNPVAVATWTGTTVNATQWGIKRVS